MTLPTRIATSHRMTIPTLNKEITYKPYTHKQQQALMIAQELKNPESITTTLMELLVECCDDSLDINQLSLCDIQYMMLKLRMVSVGEETSVAIHCQHCEVDRESEKYKPEEDKAIHKETIDLEGIEVEFPENKDELSKFIYNDGVDDWVVEMKYPTYPVMQRHNKSIAEIKKIMNSPDDNLSGQEKIDADTKKAVEMHKRTVEIWDNTVHNILDKMYKKGDSNGRVVMCNEYKDNEMQAFIDSLSVKNTEDIRNFLDNVPVLNKLIRFDCGDCGKLNEYRLTGTEDFL